MKWKISPLDNSFDKSHFDCGYVQLNQFLKKYANFQPIYPNFGIFPSFPNRIRSKKERYHAYRDRSLSDLDLFRFQIGD